MSMQLGCFFIQAVCTAIGLGGQSSGWIWSETKSRIAAITASPNLYAGLNSFYLQSWYYCTGGSCYYTSSNDMSLGRVDGDLIDEAKTTMICLGISIGLSVIACLIMFLGRTKGDSGSPMIGFVGGFLGLAGSLLTIIFSIFYVSKASSAFDSTFDITSNSLTYTIDGGSSGPYPSWSFYFAFFGGFFGFAACYFVFFRIRKILNEKKTSN